MDQYKWLAVAALVGYFLYTNWDSIKSRLPSLSKVTDAVTSSDNEDDVFHAYRTLRKWSANIKGDEGEEAAKCLTALAPILFGPQREGGE